MKRRIVLLTKPVSLPYWWQDLLLLIPRCYCGYLLAFDFGSYKFGMPWSPPENNLGLFEVVFWFPNDVAAYGGIFKMFPGILAWMGAFSEAVGGLAWIAGLQTRLFSFLMAITMLVAAFIQQGDNGMWQQLPALGFLWVSMYLMFLGGGRFSIDFITTKKMQHVTI